MEPSGSGPQRGRLLRDRIQGLFRQLELDAMQPGQESLLLER